MVSFICYTSTPLCGSQGSSSCCWGCEEQLVHLLLAAAFYKFWNALMHPLFFPWELTHLLCSLLLSFLFSVLSSSSQQFVHLGYIHELCASVGRGEGWLQVSPMQDMPIHTALHTVCLLQSKMPLLLKLCLWSAVTTGPFWMSRSCTVIKGGDVQSVLCVECYGSGCNLCQLALIPSANRTVASTSGG